MVFNNVLFALTLVVVILRPYEDDIKSVGKATGL